MGRKTLVFLVLFVLLSMPSMALAEQQINTAFLFHFNQNLVPYSELADHACYVGLLQMLRSLKPTPFVLHISGTLLMEWQWNGSEALQLVKEGIEDGQFEILGSTFAQNIIYSVDSRTDNLYQIQLHREILEDVLGVSPVGFWNAERVWDESLIDLIGECGYEYTFLETPILAKSGVEYGDLRKLHVVEGEQHNLILVPDDLDFRNNVNRRQVAGVVAYLKAQNRRDEDGSYFILYAEDAEATGLWDLERGNSPEAAWEDLRAVLVRLIEEPTVQITKIGDYLEARQDQATSIKAVTGQPDWMIGPSVQQGYRDWFDYNATNQDIIYFRELYNNCSKEIQRVTRLASHLHSPAVEQLLKHAKQTLAISQYEFAAIGAGHRGVAMWELARTALVPTKIAEFLVTGLPTEPLMVDINQDGIEEIILVEGNNFYVFTSLGAKLLYWFRLDTGEQVVGNEAGFHYGEIFTNDSAYTRPLSVYSPLWFWLPKSDFLEPLLDNKYVVRRRVGNDVFLDQGTPVYGYVDEKYKISLTEEGLLFSLTSGAVHLEKEYRVAGDTLTLTYNIHGTEGYQFLKVENGLAPSYYDLLRSGASSLKISDILHGFSVTNTNTGLTVQLVAPQASYIVRPGQMRYGEQIDLSFALSQEHPQQFSVEFRVHYEGSAVHE